MLGDGGESDEDDAVRVLSRGRRRAEDADPEFERELAELLREPAPAPGGGGVPSADDGGDQV